MKKLLSTLSIIITLQGVVFASYDEALKLFENNKYQESLDILGNELVVSDDMKPDAPNYKIRYLAAHNHWHLGNIQSAIAHLKRCMDIRKDSIDPYIDLALIQIEQKQYSDADETARDGLKIMKSAKLFYVLGVVSLKRKNFWRAKDLFEKANSLDPELYYSYNALGIALMNLKKYGEANAAFTVASAMRPKSPEIQNNLGMSLEKLGKNKKAYEYYKKANELDDENKVIIRNLTRIKEKLED